jgi:tRNA A-37 threonylcarbamoyl transferase component Bud32
MQNPWLLMADEQFYAPVEPAADAPGRLGPADVPDGWTRQDHGVWRHWSPPGPPGPEQGWKVHVSATPDRLSAVLDAVARACFGQGVPFKHLATPDCFLMLHQKHSSRVQAGKFCAAYPSGVPAARLLMERLACDLAGEPGAYVLTDRRFRDSRVVHYRYGAFRRRERLLADGTRLPLVRDADGNDVPDERRPSFVLPPGVTDPFAAARRPAATGGPAGTARQDREPARPIVLNERFEVQEVVRHSNGGGCYRALDRRTGATVFVKEARADNGYGADWQDARTRLRREHATLVRIHAEAPGLCPEPVDYFTGWEHEFLVTEFVAGRPLLTWAAVHQVLPQMDTGAERRAAYLARAGEIVDRLTADVERLHAIGLRFGDLSHGNVLVGDDGTVRLIDFETATPLTEPPLEMGTLGYQVPKGLREQGVDGDAYGLAALAMLLLFPLARPLQADPAGRLELHRRDLDRHLPLPDRLWERAARYYRLHERTPPAGPARSPFALPTAADLDRDPRACLAALGDGLAAGITAMAGPEDAGRLYPPSPAGYRTNTHCLADGSAGVLLALHRWGAPVPDAHRERFRRDALAASAGLAPGLQAGSAGIAWVLAELGHREEAERLLGEAAGHPLLATSSLLGHGAAGVGMVHLQLAALTGEPAHLERAARTADALLGDGLAGVLGEAGTPGLDEGLSGVALFLHALAGRTGDARYTAAALRLAHAELDKAEDHGEDGLRFTDRGGRRVITYLSIGSAGVAAVASRLAADTGDARCAALLPRLLVPCLATSSVEPGLYTGLASWAYAMAEHADHAGGPDDRATAVRIATSLAKYTVRFPGGLRVLGSFEPRFHCDLATGGAGVLLALARVLGGPRDGLFTADARSAPEPGRVPAPEPGRLPAPGPARESAVP